MKISDDITLQKHRKVDEIVCVQPGIRYQQTKAFLEFSLNKFANNYILTRNISKNFDNSIKGIILEDSVYMELESLIYKANEQFNNNVVDHSVFKNSKKHDRFGICKMKFENSYTQQPKGEYDIVIFDSVYKQFSIFEVKHASKHKIGFAKNIINNGLRKILLEQYHEIISLMSTYNFL